VLEAPGTADMTANVDFEFLKQSLRGKAQAYGPVTQRSFLKEMGIDERMKVLELTFENRLTGRVSLQA
jgi:NADH dehydrogenase [ubiquinone] 1 alpha subcomplex assembly factor 7